MKSGVYEDILYDTWDGIAKITINRPEVRNAFRPTTVFEMGRAFEAARNDPEIGVIILTGEGTEAFCSGGDQRVRGDDGYRDQKGIGRLNILDVQVQIRRLPKPVIAMVAGYAIGGGNVLHVVCDLTIAADNARFGQTGPRVGSFDGGYGAGLLARIVGQKKAREIWLLCEQYDAQQALEMGLVNKVVPLEKLEAETVAWCRRMLELSPLALRMVKAGLNDADDGLGGIQQLARGADSAKRMGPVRAASSGVVAPEHVRLAAMAAFGVAGLVGAILSLTTDWRLLIVGAACLLAGWLYTGGPRPYGYMGMGEIFVL